MTRPPVRLRYVITFVADMDLAVRLHRDTFGLPLRFHSPGWSEFDTGEVTLALHPVTATQPHGSVQLGLRTNDLDGFLAAVAAGGLTVTQPPVAEHGTLLARVVDSTGIEYSVAAPDPAARRG